MEFDPPYIKLIILFQTQFALTHFRWRHNQNNLAWSNYIYIWDSAAWHKHEQLVVFLLPGLENIRHDHQEVTELLVWHTHSGRFHFVITQQWNVCCKDTSKLIMWPLWWWNMWPFHDQNLTNWLHILYPDEYEKLARDRKDSRRQCCHCVYAMLYFGLSHFSFLLFAGIFK